MAYYIRKISRSKWPEKPLSSDVDEAKKEVSQVSADAITNCTKTKENKLSLWKLDKMTNSIDDIIPLILGFERPDTCDVIYIDEETFEKAGLELEQSLEDANTPLESFKKCHYNVIVKDYDGLGKFSRVVLQSLENYRRFSKKEVKGKLKDLLEQHVIEKEMISEKLYEKLAGSLEYPC